MADNNAQLEEIARKASLYTHTFSNDPSGRKVLEDLVARFYDVEVFVQGGQDGDRATAYKAGSRAVVHYILRQLAQIKE